MLSVVTKGFLAQPVTPKILVSAVLITTFTVSGLVNAKHYLYANPFAKREIEFLTFNDLTGNISLTDGYIKEFG